MMNLAQDELQAWLALASGGLAARQRARRLLAHFGGPLQVWAASDAEWQVALEGDRAEGLRPQFGAMHSTALHTLAWLAASPSHHVLCLGDPHYPAALLESPDPPLLLHAVGRLASLGHPAVALVGSRHATPAGQRLAGRLAAELAVLGVAVVSGLAVGIDAAAHEATLTTGGPGATIAVVASGLDAVYPRQHRGLFQRIAEAGLVVSEHPLGTPALPAYFPQRNRIIAGLSCAVVVVEATLRSGSLITARLASEAGRDVFAVPGPLSSAQSAGCNRLIKSGAGLLEHVGDIVESQPWAFSAEVRQAVAPPGRRKKRHSTAPAGFGLLVEPPRDQSPLPEGAGHGALLQPAGPGGLSPSSWSRVSRMLRAKPCDLPELAGAVSESASAVSHTLLMAELQGLVARLPGSLYQWCGET